MVMGVTDTDSSSQPLIPNSPSRSTKIPKDSFHLAYIIYFTLGTGFLLPFNAFITAVDYFSYLYPGASVDRVFQNVFTSVDLVFIVLVLIFKQKSSAFARINTGSVLFLVALLAVPLMDAWYVKGTVGVYSAYYVTVCLVGLCGIADALVQSGVIGSAGELPERYMQAMVAGTSASGVLVSLLRILTKATYPQDANGLRKSANLHFVVGLSMVFLCIILYNMAHKLPVIKYYNQLKIEAVVKNDDDDDDEAISTRVFLRSTLWDIFGTMKWYGFGVLMVFAVSFIIFPGSLTEDFHSEMLKDWYPILLIMAFNVFDLVGKSLTSVYLIKNENVSLFASFARLIFLPIFYGCSHGPKFLRTEVPVSILNCLLGLSNGYLFSILMILAPKTVHLKHAETVGIFLGLFTVLGTTIGSALSWLLVI